MICKLSWYSTKECLNIHRPTCPVCTTRNQQINNYQILIHADGWISEGNNVMSYEWKGDILSKKHYHMLYYHKICRASSVKLIIHNYYARSCEMDISYGNQNFSHMVTSHYVRVRSLINFHNFTTAEDRFDTENVNRRLYSNMNIYKCKRITNTTNDRYLRRCLN